MIKARLFRLGMVLFLLVPSLGSLPSQAALLRVVDTTDSPAKAPIEKTTKKEVILRTLPWLLIVTFSLLLLFLFGIWAVHRYVRRYRAGMGGKRSTPTASESVWAMHRLPDSDDNRDSESDDSENR
ncbi:MAG: hypothetical protein AABZ47_03490 [Planctomycetota bacterium]